MNIRQTLPTMLALLLAFGAIPIQAQNYEDVFHANISTAQFGYDYVDDVEATTDGHDEYSFDACLLLSGDRGNPAFLGKTLQGGNHYRVGFEIETASEGRSGRFIAAFSLASAAPSAASAGDGESTGAFRNSIKATFDEDGNTWIVQLTQVRDGIETPLGSSATLPDPNDRSMFYLDVDLVDGTASIQDAGLTELVGDDLQEVEETGIHSQWFVGTRVNTGSLNAQTCIHDDDDSTSIRDYTDYPPVVEEVTFAPAQNIDDQDTIAVDATATDDFGLDDVFLDIRVDDGDWTANPMALSGGEYSATIAAYPNGTLVWFEVRAVDNAGQETTGDRYHYEVGTIGAIGNQGGGTNTNGNGDVADEDGGKAILYGVLIAVAGLAIGLILVRFAGKAIVLPFTLGGLVIGGAYALLNGPASSALSSLTTLNPWVYALVAVLVAVLVVALRRR